jgi:hypothetical protein
MQHLCFKKGKKKTGGGGRGQRRGGKKRERKCMLELEKGLKTMENQHKV